MWILWHCYKQKDKWWLMFHIECWIFGLCILCRSITDGWLCKTTYFFLLILYKKKLYKHSKVLLSLLQFWYKQPTAILHPHPSNQPFLTWFHMLYITKKSQLLQHSNTTYFNSRRISNRGPTSANSTWFPVFT